MEKTILKMIATSVTTVIASALLLSACGKVSEQETAEPTMQPNGATVALASEQAAPISYETEDGVQINVVRSYRIRATAYDEDGEQVDETLQKFSFTVDWKVPHTADVNDYVILTDVTEREVTLGLIRAFDDSILLTATSLFDSSVRETLPCSFVQRVNGILFTYSKEMPDWTKNPDPQYHDYLYMHEEMRTMQSGETATLHLSDVTYHGGSGGQRGAWVLRVLTTGSPTFDKIGGANNVIRYNCSARYSGEFLSKLRTGSEYAISSDWTTLYGYNIYNFESHTVGSTEYSQWGLLTALAKDGSGNGAVEYYLGTASHNSPCQGPDEKRFLETLASTEKPIEMRVTLTTTYGKSYSFEFFFNVRIEA